MRAEALDIDVAQLPMMKEVVEPEKKILHVGDLISENAGSRPRQVVLR